MPLESSQYTTLADVVTAALQCKLSDMYTSMPGIVVRSVSTNHTVDVQPQCKYRYIDEDGIQRAINLPIIHNVPVVFDGSGDIGVTYPIKVGHTVLLVFSSRSLRAWKRSNADTVDPGSDQMHHISDAMAIPGLRSPASIPQGMTIDPEAFTVHADHIKLGRDANEGVIRTSDLESALKGALSDPGIAQAIYDRPAMNAVTPESGDAALLGAVNTYFAAHAVSGSDVVKAE